MTPTVVASAGGAPPSPALPPAGQVVLDASFVIALLEDEPTAARFTAVLPRGVLPSVTAGEVLYVLAARAGLAAVDVEDGLSALGVRIEALPLAAARHFPALRAIDAARRAEQRAAGERAATLSLADLCVLGYAWSTDLPVLTGDRHWTTLAPHGLPVPVHTFRDP